MRFKKTVFRITKGNCLVVTVGFKDLFDDLLTGE